MNGTWRGSHIDLHRSRQGGSVTLRRMPTVKFAPDAADYFVEVLTILCRDTAAVTVHPLDGEPFGAVLVSNDAKALVGFKSLTEGMDTSTSGGKLVFGIFGALAEFERSVQPCQFPFTYWTVTVIPLPSSPMTGVPT